MSNGTCLCQKICKWYVEEDGGCKLFTDEYCEHLNEMLDKLFDDEFKNEDGGW